MALSSYILPQIVYKCLLLLLADVAHYVLKLDYFLSHSSMFCVHVISIYIISCSCIFHIYATLFLSFYGMMPMVCETVFSQVLAYKRIYRA